MSCRSKHAELLALFLAFLFAGMAAAHAADAPKVIPLYPPGSPTLQGQDQKEIFTPAVPVPGKHYSIKNVHNPTIEVYLAPKETANGTIIVVAPGGGHRELGWYSEGIKIAEWLNSLGVGAA